MKQVLWITGLLLGSLHWAGATTPIPLHEALEKGIVKAEVRATGETATNVSSYYGACMKARLTNLTDTAVNVKLVPGYYLMPEKDELQRMLILEDEIIVLGPKSKEEYILAVMCTEKYDSAPSRNASYSLGEPAPRQVIELAEMLNSEKWYGHTGQSAVWAMHHQDIPLDFIHSDDAEKQSKLRLFVKSARERQGLPPIRDRHERVAFAGLNPGQMPEREPETYTLTKWKITIQGEFRYTLAEPIVGSMYIYDEAGEVRFTYFEGQNIPAGQRTFNFRFSSFTYDESEQFYLRLQDANGRVVKERRISTD